VVSRSINDYRTAHQPHAWGALMSETASWIIILVLLLAALWIESSERKEK
jgi:hypothetical protein